jgi:hypothetical protein
VGIGLLVSVNEQNTIPMAIERVIARGGEQTLENALHEQTRYARELMRKRKLKDADESRSSLLARAPTMFRRVGKIT